jgi:hypothetical protein
VQRPRLGAPARRPDRRRTCGGNTGFGRTGESRQATQGSQSAARSSAGKIVRATEPNRIANHLPRSGRRPDGAGGAVGGNKSHAARRTPYIPDTRRSVTTVAARAG